MYDSASVKSLCVETIVRDRDYQMLLSHFHWLPLWCSGKRSWPQIQRSGFDTRRQQIFWKVVGLQRGLLSLVSTNEELLEKKKVAAPV
jgi:hypothetical protein